jgi:two-component system OmpR family sensor kinase/two-component system sensor histidine kinase QseC
MNSIRVRLLASLLAAIAVAALAMAGFTYRNVLQETRALFDYQLRQMALSLRDQGEITGRDAFREEGFDFVVQIWTADGRAIYASRPFTTLPNRAVLGFADVTVEGFTWRAFSVAAGDRVIQVAQPVQIRQELAARAALRSVMPLLLIAPVMALAVWWLVAVSLAPLRRVSAEVRRRDVQALEPLDPGGLPEEVAPLVHSLNALLRQLRASFDAQRAFVSDAAHELRSPLASLKLQLGLLRRAQDDATRRQAVESLASGIDRAARLVDQMLTLARNEPAVPRPGTERLDLGELARQAVADAVPLALERDTELSLDAEEPVEIDGDRAGLAALVRNLADNAVRHAPRGSKVRVAVAREGQEAVLTVDDNGPGIAAAERERVFDRFYRGNAEASGTGLGLAIVRNVAQRHAARAELLDSPLGGLRVQVRFPRP